MPDWRELKKIVDAHQTFVLTCHVRPDSDALGSELALACLLQDLGKDVRIANPSNAPNTLDFLNNDDLVKVLGQGITAEEVLSSDVHIILDTSAWSQLQGVGEIFRKTEAVKVVIDHHVSSDDLNAHDFKDTTAEATGALIFRFAKECGLRVSEKAAFYMFCAIATDTGWFRFPSVSSQTYRDIAEMIDLGVKPHLVYGELYERSSLARHHLSGRVLQRITTIEKGLVSWTWVAREDFHETGAKPVDTEDLVNECLRIEGTKVAFIAVEQENGQVKFSFRARLGSNVAIIAEQFGGGGHTLAAGAMLPGPLDKAKQLVLEAVTTSVAEQQNLSATNPA
ncbi:bifunctional oligoribonuclease/PAP phosphatase NrnA [Planctomycetaceae bacterium]|jgi:bifunctional oligoribonuclease and PAP phosphatase NrnA|nr:bifunctional oligoribonuclease/PAP phosphatase NrnA [Planctomycetaceae bacterium]MDC0273520.1 bifunctional oligoribonuclease/PAP phosphatase NrnA [Planctomycetaceae bacterium]